MSATILAIANQKGGVGKTTTTANLGIGLASTSAVRIYRKNEWFNLAFEMLILLSRKAHFFVPKLKIPPEAFRKALVFICFDDYNYIEIL